MNVDCSTIQTKLIGFTLVKDCDVLHDGTLRLSTALLYPDGSQIDVFYQSNEGYLLPSARLTDLGQTAAFLAHLDVYIGDSERREQILHDVCGTLDVGSINGELYINIDPEHDLADGILRLAQACVRIADICYTQSFRNKSDFHQVFASFLNKERPDSIENFFIEGRFGRKIRLDFFTRQKTRPDNLIITLSSTNKTSSHSVANDVFCRWYDLERYRRDYEFLTVFDATSKAFVAADLNRIGNVSRVINFPTAADTLHNLLLN